MKPMGCLRVAIVAVVLSAGVLGAAAPAGAVWTNREDSQGQEGEGQRGEGQGGALAGGTLSVNLAIMALGSLWLVLMARRMQLRGAGDGGRMLIPTRVDPRRMGQRGSV